ncbi:hypothetical protein DXG01_009461, partial [Tephrocybe rancida]
DPEFAALVAHKEWRESIVVDLETWDTTYASLQTDIVLVIDGPYKIDKDIADQLGYSDIENINSRYDRLQDAFNDTTVPLELAEVIIKHFARRSSSPPPSPPPPSPPPAPAPRLPEPVIDIPPGGNPVKAIFNIVSSASFQNPLSPENRAIKKANAFKLGDPNLGPLWRPYGRPLSNRHTGQTLGLLSVVSGARHTAKTHRYLPPLLHDEINDETGHIDEHELALLIASHTLGILFSGIHDYPQATSLEPFLISHLLEVSATHKFARAIKLAHMWTLSLCRLHVDVQNTLLLASHGLLLPDPHRDVITVQDSMYLAPDRLFAERDEVHCLTLMSCGASSSPELIRTKLEAYNLYAKLEHEVFLPRDTGFTATGSSTAAAAATEMIGLGNIQNFASIFFVCGCASLSQGRRFCLADTMDLIDRYHGSNPQERQRLSELVRAREWTKIFKSHTILKVKIGESVVNHPYGSKMMCDVVQEVGLMHPNFGALSGSAHNIRKLSNQLFPPLPESLVMTCASLTVASLILLYEQNETSERVRSGASDARPAIRISDPAAHGVISPFYSAAHNSPHERERLRLIVIIQEAWLAIRARTLTADGKNRWVYTSLPRHGVNPDSPGASEGDQLRK